MNYETMKRKGVSPYGPSKAALESETIIWTQYLEGTGITVNEILPGGATATGMIPDGLSEELRSRLLNPEIIVPPTIFLASAAGSPAGDLRRQNGRLRTLTACRHRSVLAEKSTRSRVTEDVDKWKLYCRYFVDHKSNSVV